MTQPICKSAEIPPYQSIDVLLAGDKIKELAAPVAGFVVTFPDKGLDAECVTEGCDIPALKVKSKWPDQVFARPCWIHSECVVYGEIHKHKHWTPR